MSAFGGHKPQFWVNFDLWGPLYRLPFTDEGQKWCAIEDPRHTFTCQISSRSVYSVALWRQKAPNFCHILPYFGLRHLVVSPIGSSLRKLSTGAQLLTFPYPTISKSFLYSNAFMAILGTHTDVQKRDGQTNRQTDRLTD